MKRSELIETICWSCWWREGDHCFSDDFGEIPKQEDGVCLKGHDITPDHIVSCRSMGGYVSKRSMLPIPSDKLIILSEHAK